MAGIKPADPRRRSRARTGPAQGQEYRPLDRRYRCDRTSIPEGPLVRCRDQGWPGAEGEQVRRPFANSPGDTIGTVLIAVVSSFVEPGKEILPHLTLRWLRLDLRSALTWVAIFPVLLPILELTRRLLAAVPGSWTRSETSGGGYHHLPVGLHSTDRKRPLGDTPQSPSNRDTVLRYCCSAGTFCTPRH
jgi:hypothetical protein